jgi:GNAT superfamily N-acetyltransferase
VPRAATIHDHPQIDAIERAAGDLFRRLGMAAVADDDPISRSDFDRYAADRRAFVWTIDDRLVAYLLLDELDGAAHIEQVSVHPDAARQGIGAQLITLADSWAAQHGFDAVTLTTFRDVPWNAPYYERLGFRILDPAEWGPGLQARMTDEASHGLNAWPRGAMRRRLPAPQPAG